MTEQVTSKDTKKKKKKGTKAAAAASIIPAKKEASLPGLPDHVKAHQIKARDGLRDKDVLISVNDVVGITNQTYVHSMHDKNPIVLERIYWVRLQNSLYVILRIEKEEYDWLVANAKLSKQDHLFTFVDCSLYPTLGYAFRASEMTGLDFPTIEMIHDYEKEHFKDNPTYFHHTKYNTKIKEKEQGEVAAAAESNDDEEEFDFEWED